jgi:cytochrome P450
MTTSDAIDDRVTRLREQSERSGGVFWAHGGKELAVFDPAAAQQANAQNYADMTIPDRFVDVLLGRESTKVSWREVRAAWVPAMRQLCSVESVEALARRMEALLDERAGRALDLMWVAQEVTTRALVPCVIAGLPARDAAWIVDDQTKKLERLCAPRARLPSIRRSASEVLSQVLAGLAVRREIGGRAEGSRPRRPDLTDPMVDMLPVLGMDRASYAVTTILTAISGPPGAVAACLVFELATRPDWEARIAGELAGIPEREFYASPQRAAPSTHRFVKEVLRLWSAPSVVTRVARAPIEVGGERVEVGGRFQLSPHAVHRDPRHWRDPERFDPDRWNEGIDHGGWFVPFGWSPTSCIGAQLGTLELMLLCRAMCLDFRVSLERPEKARIEQSAVPLPMDFRGRVLRRG